MGIYWGFVIYAYQDDIVFGRKMGLVHLQKKGFDMIQPKMFHGKMGMFENG
jgi:hypothetical protein